MDSFFFLFIYFKRFVYIFISFRKHKSLQKSKSNDIQQFQWADKKMLAMEKNQQLNTHSLSAESLYGFLWEIKKIFFVYFYRVYVSKFIHVLWVWIEKGLCVFNLICRLVPLLSTLYVVSHRHPCSQFK